MYIEESAIKKQVMGIVDGINTIQYLYWGFLTTIRIHLINLVRRSMCSHTEMNIHMD